jgi:DNA-binding NtrC family response regulator
MPEVDGITLMKRIRAKWPETDVIIITGNADKAVAIQALRLGAFDLADAREFACTVKSVQSLIFTLIFTFVLSVPGLG